MEKYVKGTILTLMVLAVAGVANADYTSSVLKTQSFGGAVYNNQPSTPSQITWTFDWTAELALLTATGVPTITDATLTVTAESINSVLDGVALENHDVYLDGIYVGTLEYSDAANDSEFTLSAATLAELADGTADMSISLFVGNSTYLAVWSKFDSASLAINYSVDTPEIPDPTPSAVPAPGAIVLCSLGAGLVGWLRKRGMA